MRKNALALAPSILNIAYYLFKMHVNIKYYRITCVIKIKPVPFIKAQVRYLDF